MKPIVDVNTGEVRVGKGQIVLRSLAIGSCVVVAGYAAKNKVGALAHIMLPGRSPEKTAGKAKYVVDALEEMVRQMVKAGVHKEHIEVCLVGGGNVLQRKGDTIGRENIDSVIQFLHESNIPIRGSILGGTERKGIFLDIESGSISYTEGDGVEKLLWKPGSQAARKH